MKFKFKPVREISVQQLMQTSVEDLVDRFAFPNGPSMMWVNGILFVHSPFPQTDDIINKAANGYILWKFIEFAKLNECPKTLVRPEGTVEVRVINVSVNRVFVNLAKWLKTQKIWRDES